MILSIASCGKNQEQQGQNEKKEENHEKKPANGVIYEEKDIHLENIKGKITIFILSSESRRKLLTWDSPVAFRFSVISSFSNSLPFSSYSFDETGNLSKIVKYVKADHSVDVDNWVITVGFMSGGQEIKNHAIEFNKKNLKKVSSKSDLLTGPKASVPLFFIISFKS